ncbi:Protein FAR1-RELATED SEQUENCE 5 [Quillaja saponaria]|uniref:Protein FAR1-RELATED SEQUENCE 5 n=1 Tax=Quillaja saponaria TaxID=32244 RepID=A0AAD7PWD2_QUISA|nr:Protein FAR1-RELATED SEQUENCE 5 [Quillaja saponaria]
MANDKEEHIAEANDTSIELNSLSDAESLKNEEDGGNKVEPAVFVMCERNENIPKIGMMFANESEAHNYYNTYAGMIGFSIRKDQYRRLTNGSLRLRTFVCSKEGQHKAKDLTHVTKRQRRETRTGCQARISFLIEDGLWIVSQFISEHNHD